MDASAVLQRLDEGSLQAIFLNTPGRVEQPTVQCVQIKPMTSSNGEPSERYRVVFSDGKNYVQTMLATQLNGEIHEGTLKRGGIVKLLTYQANNVRGKRILIVTSIRAFPELGEHEKLGEPVMMDIKDEGTTDTITSNGFYGQQDQQQQQSRSMPSHTKPPSSSASHANIYPIEGLSPFSHKWTIKARCTNKSDIKTWHNRNGEGQLFSVSLLDDSGEIRATGFNDQCKQLFDVFQEGSVYYISSPARIQMAKKQYSNVNNDYEITFERDTVVEKAEMQDDVPQVRYNFTTLADLNTVDKDTTVDVVGVLKDIGEVSQVISKTTSKPYEKRELTLVDDTNYSIRLTIWGKTASTFEIPPESVVAFKGVKVSDFGGRSLSLLASGSMATNPDLPDAHRLRGWYDHAGQAQQTFANHNNVTGTTAPGGARKDSTKTCAAVKDESLGQSDAPDFFDLKASVQYIKQEPSFCYPACRSEGCSKKVNEIEPGQWRCEKCNIVHDRPEYRYILKINVSDYTGQLWLNCFDDVGRMIMGKSANELMEIQENGGENSTKRLGEIFADANYKVYNFKCLAKTDSYQEQQTIRYQVRSAMALDFAAESQKLATMIKHYENMNV